MQRRTLTVLAVALGVVLAAAVLLTWRQVERLQQELTLQQSVAQQLQLDLEAARVAANAAEARATEADTVASFLEVRAAEAEQRAELAGASATAERQRARDARIAAAEARSQASAAQTEASRAKRAQEQAESERMAALRKAEDAELEAWRARRRTEELEKQRNRDLDRLESALGRLAETRRTALGVVMNLGDSIEFDFNQAELRPEARELLSRIAGVLLTAEEFGIQVYGHTDDVGSDAYNLELSERRAAAVRDYLLGAGIQPDQIAMKGFGMRAPLVEGSDEAARQRNRRVEIAIVQISEDVVDVLPELPAADG